MDPLKGLPEMNEGIWHATIPITDEHVFLHLLRILVLRSYGHEINIKPDSFSSWLEEKKRLPSPYVTASVRRKWNFLNRIWTVEPTKLGCFYCDFVYTYVKKLEHKKEDILRQREQPKNTVNRKIQWRDLDGPTYFRKILPKLLIKYGFSSRADFLVKWSIFHGALGREEAPLKCNQKLNIFDNLSVGIPSSEEAKKTICMSPNKYL